MSLTLSPSPAGVNAYPINSAAMAGYDEWWRALAPAEDQMEAPPPLMLTKVNHGVVYEIPPDPVFVVQPDETFAIAPERA